MNKFSTLSKLAALTLAGLWLSGCAPSPVEDGLAQILTRDKLPEVTMVVKAISCETPVAEVRDCTVGYARDVKLPDTKIKLAAPKDSYPVSFEFQHFYYDGPFMGRGYQVAVKTPLNGETLDASTASKQLIAVLAQAVHTAQAQLGDEYTKRVTAYKNLSSY